MAVIMIACTDIEGGLGKKDGSLLFKISKDMMHFKSVTDGRLILFGRKTWESLPKRPLEKRKNYIITNDKEFKANGAKVIHSIDEVLELSKTLDVYVCGGGEIYEQLMPHADKLIMTHVHVIDRSAEVFFPEIDVKQWKLVNAERHEPDKKTPYSFTFAEYERKK